MSNELLSTSELAPAGADRGQVMLPSGILKFNRVKAEAAIFQGKIKRRRA